MKSKYLSIGLLAIGLFIGFGGGYYYKGIAQQKQFSQMRNGSGQGMMRPEGLGMQQGTQNRTNGMGSVDGTIISMDDKSVVVKLSDGSTKNILFSELTSYSSFLEAKKSDLKNGLKVMIFGKANTDGSVTAERIQLNYGGSETKK